MRIIAGEHRGRRIDAPPGRGTRPMLDRVREALFSRLQPRLPGARVLDLFAGSGSLGLEALSRGAERARMIERDARVLRLLEGNVEALGVAPRAEVVRGDALDARTWTWADGVEGFDVVLVDAPYPLIERRTSCEEVLAACRMLALERVAEDGEVVLHAPRGALAAASFGGGLDVEQRTYGTNDLWFLAAGSTR